MTLPWKYRAFLSYSHRDARWATWLHRKLEGYTVPKALIGQLTELGPVPERIAPIFRDREEFATKADLGAAVEEALSQALFLIVICSPNSAKSRWVDEEVARFKRLGNPAHILCLLVDGDPGAQPGSDQDCFPSSLRTRTDSQGREVTVEPLAADVRNSGDGKRSALLKLAASVLGVNYDQLQQREAARRQRRMAIITGASMAGVLMTTALAISAVLARQEAEQQRNRAQLEAETANRTTEFMVDLFTVSDPGENRGNTITAKEILERGRSRIGNALKDQPRIRSRLMLTMGRVYNGLGLYDTAEQLLADAHTQPAPDQSAEDAMRIAVALGTSEYLLGKYEDARSRLAGALEIARKNTLPWSKTRSQAHLQYGATLVEFDALEEAEGHYRLALEADQSTFGSDDSQVGNSHNGLGRVLLFQGRVEESEVQFETAHQNFLSALGEDHPLTVEALNNLATNHYFARKFDAAHKTLLDLVPMYRRLLGEAHPELASVLNNLGRTHLELGNLQEARTALLESVAIDRALGRERHIDLVFSLNSLGVAEAALDNTDSAAAIFTEARVLAEATEHRMLGPILAYQAELACTGSTGASVGNALLAQALPLVNETYGEDHWRSAYVEHIRGLCLIAGGDPSGGHELLSRTAKLLEAELPDGFFTRRAAANVERLRS